jgi:hypothetical protein
MLGVWRTDAVRGVAGNIAMRLFHTASSRRNSLTAKFLVHLCIAEHVVAYNHGTVASFESTTVYSSVSSSGSSKEPMNDPPIHCRVERMA